MSISVSDGKALKQVEKYRFEEQEKILSKKEWNEALRLKNEKSSPYTRWTQFNLEQTQKTMWLQLRHPKAAAIMTFLVDQMDEYNAVMCSYKVIQELLGIAHATVAKNIKILKENKFIAVLKSGSSNVYAINDSVYWKSWGSNRKYSKFSAAVVLSESEQEENFSFLPMPEIDATKHKEITIKPKGDDIYTVLERCARSMETLNS